ncbi:MAG TPA: terminase family protein, partial [Burkholderiales bacterium]|nr:terminase family protein [Burkholderiales bacterium]
MAESFPATGAPTIAEKNAEIVGRATAIKKLTLDQTLAVLEEAVRTRAESRMSFFRPYPKQARFIELTRIKREVMLMAANQYGKSDVGAFIAACHLTGIYPKWWAGKKWTRPTRGWIAGETSLVVRDVQQKKLCGEPGVVSAHGTGMIPKDCLVDYSLARGITDAFDTIQVKHVSGGISIGRFKSYEQGRTKFQGETLDWGWPDEEPDEDVYSEFLTRLSEGGSMFMTFTPMKGRSKVVLRFLEEASQDRSVVNATLDEAEHFSAEEKKRRLEGYLAHERDARARGIPILGSGAVYGFDEALIREDPIPLDRIPPQWAKLWGIDIGIDHPFAAVLMAHDRDVDCIHILHAFRMVGAIPLMHSAAMKNVAAAVP